MNMLELKRLEEDQRLEREAEKAIAAQKLKARQKKLEPKEGLEGGLKQDPKSEPTKREKIGAAKEILSQAGLSGKNTENTSMGAAGGAMQGALAGSAFGWQGAVVGGAVGGLSGGLQARAAKKRRLAEIEANKFRELGAIEERKGKQINDALENLNQAFQRSLLSSGNLTLF